MILLSNLIKAPQSEKNRRLIELQFIEPVLFSGIDSKEDPRAIEQKLTQDLIQTKKDIEKMLFEAEQKVRQADQDIEDKRAAFEKECEAIRNQERQKAYNEGFQQGQAEGQASYNTLLDETNQWIEKAEQQFNQSVQEAEPQILELSVQIAETILNTRLGEQSQWLPLVKRALAEVKDQEHFKITVSTSRYAFMVEQKHELVELIQDSPLFIYVDDSFQENDCLIETPSGQLHASVDSQLKVIRKTLLDLLEEEQL